MIPMVVTEKHIEEIEKCISGKVYWCGSEEEALEKGYDAEILFIWGGSGKMPETYCKQSKRLKWINSFSAGVNPIMDGSISELPVRLTNAKGIHGKTMSTFPSRFTTVMRKSFNTLCCRWFRSLRHFQP